MSDPKGASREPGPVDPGTVREAEALMAQLSGVESARIVLDEHGVVVEVHALASALRPAKAVARDIESCLYSALGFKIDHRKISVAQLRAGEGPPRLPIAVRPRFASIHFEPLGGLKSRAEVTLHAAGDEYRGQWVEADIEAARMAMAAQATLRALEAYLANTYAFALDGIQVVEFFDRPVMVVLVTIVGEGGSQQRVGAALVRDEHDRAAVFATLDAINRFISRTDL